jgi:hypothetical protein
MTRNMRNKTEIADLPLPSGVVVQTGAHPLLNGAIWEVWQNQDSGAQALAERPATWLIYPICHETQILDSLQGSTYKRPPV